jgi:hypothetical protein
MKLTPIPMSTPPTMYGNMPNGNMVMHLDTGANKFSC